MRLAHTTWPRVARYLEGCKGIIIPTGSTEQHGTMGPIGTDAMVAQAIALKAAEPHGWLVAPCLSVGPAQFYFLNGHGANIATVQAACQDFYAPWSLGQRSGEAPQCRLRSWWDYPRANLLRRRLYGDWEGMHATPSELAIAMALLGPDYPADDRASADRPPEPLPEGYARLHAGDNHLDAQRHRQQFPDGRVGSHSALAKPEHGHELLAAAADDAQQDIAGFFAS
jgi:creatinine amidohydrolase